MANTTMRRSAGVTLEHVSKVFPPDVVAVRDLSLDVEPGEFLVLVGPSGCGKSTLLRMIAGLEEMSSGDVSIGGRVVTHMAPRDRDVAMVFQNYALYPYMTVRQNIGFGLWLRGVPRRERREKVEAVARALGLESMLGRSPAALSGGQRQRVAMARAMVRNPDVYLMDEPLSNLDAKLRVALRAELARMHAHLGATIIYVTHDQVEAMTLGTRVAVLRDGILQQCDKPSVLYKDPANVFVAGFIGSPSMNLIAGSVSDGRLSAGEWSPRFDDERLKYCDGDEVIIGVRPNRMSLRSREGGPGSTGLPGVVEVVEELGAEQHVIVGVDLPGFVALLTSDEGHANGSAVVGRQQLITVVVEESTAVRVGSSVVVDVDPSALHVFDAHTGLAIKSPVLSGAADA